MKTFSIKDYDPVTKTFSPAWDRKKYIKIIKGYSDEFCHNIYRLIMRPQSSSAKHWFSEAFTWLDDAIGIKLEIKRKPVWNLFAFILDENKEDFPIGMNSKWMIRKVTREAMYGTIMNSDPDYIESKVRELYEFINPDKVYSGEEITELFYKWYCSINNSGRSFKLSN